MFCYCTLPPFISFFQLLCEQVSVHQVGVEKLKKAAEGLLDTKVGLLLNKDEIQKPLGI